MSSGEVLPFNRLKNCRHGQLIYNVHDMYIGRSLDLYGEYSEGEVDLFRQILRPGLTVVEVGANIGAHTVFLARHVAPGGRVLAFEPQRVVFQTLCGNLALNSLDNVWCYPHAVGAAPGEIVVPWIDYRQQANYGGLALGGFEQGDRVGVVTLDSLNLPRCHFIKIDVEGMERDVLAGAVETLARLKPLLYVENDRPDQSAQLIRFLDGQNYAMYWHTPALFNPQNFFGNGENVFGRIVSQNMICVHKHSPHQLQGFPAVAVPG